MPIKMNDLLKIEDPGQYKLHLAGTSENTRPLDEYVAGQSYWQEWNESKGNKNDWTRDYVFSLMEFYPKKDSWLFGGVFKILKRGVDHYELERVASFEKYEGRLIVSFHRYQGMRGRGIPPGELS